MRRLALSMCLLLVTLLGAAAPVAAQNAQAAPYADRQLADPAREARAVALMETLRCVTCQSQSIHDSDAPLAGDMRHLVRTRIAAGEDPESVRAWMMQRYGDYISYAPRLDSVTWPLFVLPAILLLVAGWLLWRRLGGRDEDEGEGAAQ